LQVRYVLYWTGLVEPPKAPGKLHARQATEQANQLIGQLEVVLDPEPAPAQSFLIPEPSARLRKRGTRANAANVTQKHCSGPTKNHGPLSAFGRPSLLARSRPHRSRSQGQGERLLRAGLDGYRYYPLPMEIVTVPKT
jgi:hypothetical protein